MKATLVTLPSKRVLVFTNDQGEVERISYPHTEYAGHAQAQDAGIPRLKLETEATALFGMRMPKPKSVAR